MDTQAILRLAAARTYAETGKGRRIRQDARLSLREVAIAVGVGQPTLSRWEVGERKPTGEAAIRWADLLDALDRQAVTAA